MIETHEFDLDWEGRRCRVRDLSSVQARQVVRRISNIVGKAVREGAQAGVDADLQVAGIIAMGAVLETLDDATVEWLTQTFGKVTEIETEAGSDEWVEPRHVSELVFGGGHGAARWLRWMSFCLEVSCADFFAAASAEFKRLKSKAGAKAKATVPEVMASPSPTTSSRTGTFTA